MTPHELLLTITDVRPADTAQVKPDLSVDTDVVDATYGAGFNIMTRWEDDRSPIEKVSFSSPSTPITNPHTRMHTSQIH